MPNRGYAVRRSGANAPVGPARWQPNSEPPLSAKLTDAGDTAFLQRFVTGLPDNSVSALGFTLAVEVMSDPLGMFSAPLAEIFTTRGERTFLTFAGGLPKRKLER